MRITLSTHTHKCFAGSSWQLSIKKYWDLMSCFVVSFKMFAEIVFLHALNKSNVKAFVNLCLRIKCCMYIKLFAECEWIQIWRIGQYASRSFSLTYTLPLIYCTRSDGNVYGAILNFKVLLIPNTVDHYSSIMVMKRDIVKSERILEIGITKKIKLIKKRLLQLEGELKKALKKASNVWKVLNPENHTINW